MGEHDGHRERFKELSLRAGLENLPSHNLFELLLYYVIPRKDTNEIGHALEKRFGSIKNVFDADYDELIKIDGIGHHAATFLKLMPQFTKLYLLSKNSGGEPLGCSTQAGEYFLLQYIGINVETVLLVTLDAQNRVIKCHELFVGSVNSTYVDKRKIVEIAMKDNAASLILAHNHPDGFAIPSKEDIATTTSVHALLKSVNVNFNDHIIVADNQFVSLADSGVFGTLKDKY